MKSIFLSLLLFVSISNYAQSNEDQIRTVLEAQVKSWNCGDLRGFMKGYWQSDSLMFIGKSGITYGYEKTLANYRKSYPDMDAMGELKFDILKMTPLAADTYFVVGKWMLQRDSGNVGGHFTLLMKKIKGKWVIVSDHSS
ncbi:MAG: nuclear transport factor 2 family protein [Chitinophagaceae bacterium]